MCYETGFRILVDAIFAVCFVAKISKCSLYYMLTPHLHTAIYKFLYRCYMDSSQRSNLKFIMFLIDGSICKKSERLQKISVGAHVSEVAAIRMWKQQGCHIAGAHNIAC